MNRFLARLFPPRGRHVAREPRQEPPSPITVAWSYTDADPAAASTVLLPPVLDPGTGHAAPVHLPEQVHVGATEDFGDVLAEMRYDLAHDSGGIDPDSLAWERELAELDKRLAGHRLTFARRWRDIVAPLAERIAPGWQHEPAVAVANFAEAHKLATGELPAVLA